VIANACPRPYCHGTLTPDLEGLRCSLCGRVAVWSETADADLLVYGRGGSQSALAAGTAPGRQRHIRPHRVAGVHAGGRF
jgi:hypothetical protein